MIFICPIVLIIPLNPLKWPAYFFGSAFESEMPDLEDKFTTPIDNLQVTAEYLDSPQSDIQWRDRMWKVLQDTSTINAIAELGHDPGSFIAGALANKMAEKYMNEMVDTALTLNEQEELYLQIFKQIAIENSQDPDLIRGTGISREYVPEYMKGDFWERPKRNARPTSWDNNNEEWDEYDKKG